MTRTSAGHVLNNGYGRGHGSGFGQEYLGDSSGGDVSSFPNGGGYFGYQGAGCGSGSGSGSGGGRKEDDGYGDGNGDGGGEDDGSGSDAFFTPVPHTT